MKSYARLGRPNLRGKEAYGMPTRHPDVPKIQKERGKDLPKQIGVSTSDVRYEATCLSVTVLVYIGQRD